MCGDKITKLAFIQIFEVFSLSGFLNMKFTCRVHVSQKRRQTPVDIGDSFCLSLLSLLDIMPLVTPDAL